MNIEIKTILIDEKKLTKSLFSQLPKYPYPFDDEDKLVETIVGYVDYKGTHLLIQQNDKLYRSKYISGISLYCSRDDYAYTENTVKQDVKERKAYITHKNIIVSNTRLTGPIELHIPHIAIDSFYVRTSQHDLPPGVACSLIVDPDDEIIEYNNKILNNLDQIFLKS